MARREYRQKNVRSLTQQLSRSYLGFRLTPGQLKASARTFFEIRISEHLNQPLKATRFHWESNALNTPRAEAAR